VRKLIVNADDFGFNREITDGILECHRRGCVTSTTLMANMPAAEYAIERAKDAPGLSVGVHLNLTLGRPVGDSNESRGLVGPDGRFRNIQHLIRHGLFLQIPKHQLYEEWSGQLNKAIALGLTPTHLDSHHNITVYPPLYSILIAVARRFHIRRLRTYRGWYRTDCTRGATLPLIPRALQYNVRRGTKLLFYEWMHRDMRRKGFAVPDRKFGFHTIIARPPLAYDMDGWVRFVRNLPGGITELVTHPGYLSQDDDDRPAYRQRRVEELRLFSDPQTRDICAEHQVELINYSQIETLELR
jgi:predicted glycoside hydrolase/deacetylase ChbG (UPF0249 family)